MKRVVIEIQGYSNTSLCFTGFERIIMMVRSGSLFHSFSFPLVLALTPRLDLVS
jgi:hypothetical protein